MKVFISLFCFLILIFITASATVLPAFSVKRSAAEVENLPPQELAAQGLSISGGDAAADFIHEMIDDFNPARILLYIEEQCRMVGVNYLFAISLLREENMAFFRLFDEIIPWNTAFEAQNSQNNNGSSDLGLWQLNDSYIWADYIPNYWHHKTDFDWKNPYHSTYIAIRHIKWMYTMIEEFNVQKGLYQSINTIYWKTAMAYNAGLNRVKSGSLPQNTLDYAFRVLDRVY